MNTKELIAELQKLDPEGNAEIVIGNSPLHYLNGPEPGWYDGRCRFVEFGKNSWEFVKAGYRRTENKINLVSIDLEEILLDYPECEIEWYGQKIEDVEERDMGAYSSEKERVSNFRQQGREHQIWRQDLHKRSEWQKQQEQKEKHSP